MIFIKKLIVFVAVFVIMTAFALPCFAWTTYSNTGLPAYPADFNSYTYKLIIHNKQTSGDTYDFGYVMYLSNSPILISRPTNSYACYLYNGVSPTSSSLVNSDGVFVYNTKVDIMLTYNTTQFSFVGKIYVYGDKYDSYGLTSWETGGWNTYFFNFVKNRTDVSLYNFTVNGSYYSNNNIFLAGQSEPFFIAEVVPPVIQPVTGVPLIVSQHGGLLSQAVSQNSLILLVTGCLLLAILLGVSLIPRVISLFR